jgi:hypothetical protein
LDCANRAPGHRQGPHILAPGPGSGGANRPPRCQADPGGPSLPRGAPKGRHNRHFQPAAGKSEMGRNFFPSHGRNSQYGPRGACKAVRPAAACGRSVAPPLCRMLRWLEAGLSSGLSAWQPAKHRGRQPAACVGCEAAPAQALDGCLQYPGSKRRSY